MSHSPSLYLFPALFYAVFTLLAYLLSLIGLPFTRPTFIFLHAVTLCLLVVWYWPRLRRPALNKLSLAPLIPCLIVLILCVVGFANALTPPHNHDTGNHFFLVRRILESGHIDYPTIYQGYSYPSWYPVALHTFLAGLLSLFNLSNLPTALPPIIWLIAGLYPAAVFFFIRSATKNYALALLSAFISLTFFMFPFNVFSWGGWAMITGLTLFWFTLGEFYELLRLPSLIKLATCSLLLVALFLTHPSEAFSFFLLAIPIALVKHRQTFFLIRTRWPSIIASGVVVGLILLPVIRQSSSRFTNAPAVPIDYLHYAFPALLQMLSDFHFSLNHNYLFTLLALIGFTLMWVRRRYLDLFITPLIIFCLFSIRVMTPTLDTLHRLTFPWLETERIYYLLLPYLSAAAAFALIYGCRRLVARRLAAPAIIAVIGLFLLIYPYSLILYANLNNLKYIQVNYAPADTRDVTLLQRNRDRCRLYLNNPRSDAGRFIPYLSGNQVLFDGPYELLPDYQTRLQLLDTVTNASLSGQLTDELTRYPFDCIYSGAFTVHNLPQEMLLPKLASNPHLTILDQENGSVIFVPSPSSPDTTSPLTLSATDSAQLK